MPATRSTAAAAITLAVSLAAPTAGAQAATTTPPPVPTDATPSGFYRPWEDWTQPWATVIAGLGVLEGEPELSSLVA